MDRRQFLKLGLLTGCGLAAAAGVGYFITRDEDPLADFYSSSQKVLAERFGERQAEALIEKLQIQYISLAPEAPYIGGETNPFTEWLNYGVFYLALYRVLEVEGLSIEQAGEIIYRSYEVMADYPKPVLKAVGALRYGRSFVDQLRAAAERSQQREYPGDFVCTFLEGDGEDLDYGLDMQECGICKFYRAQGAAELAPYMCLSDYVISEAFDRGLVRYQTLAEGGLRCDFRYKAGRPTYVHPLRDGWPPQFGQA